ncbi:MAG: polysaccharide deacetylase family protein [Thermoanaerobaculia bacterium]
MVLARGSSDQRGRLRGASAHEGCAAVRRHAIRRLILGFAAVAPFIAFAWWSTSPLLAIGVVFASHMLVLYPTLRANSQWLGDVVTHFETERNEVWLTIDDGPDPVDTPAFLNTLARHDARATFFTKGMRIEAQRELARAITEAGCEIANHSWSHPSGSFWCLGPDRIASEVDRAQEAIARAARIVPNRFRAPVGMKNPFVHPILESRKLHLIGWSARGFDGVDFDPQVAAGAILRDVTPGTIVLLHEGRAAADGHRLSQECLDLVLEGLDARGYRCVIPGDDQLLAGRRKTNR